MSKLTLVMDSQRLNEIQLCPEKYNLGFVNNLILPQKQEFFESGTLMHEMLATYYKVRKYRSRWEQNKHDHDKIIAICHRVAKHFLIKMSLPVETAFEHLEVFEQYVRHFQHDGWETLAVEQAGVKELYDSEDLRILYEVKIDLVARIQGRIFAVDHKTSRRRQEPTDMSNQFMGYCWFLGIPNLIVNKIGFQTSLKPKDKFNRYVLSYSPERLEEWKDNTVWWGRRLAFHLQNNSWPKNLTSCDKWGGCIYQKICQVEPAARPWRISRDYEVRERAWDPSGSLGKGVEDAEEV